MVWRPFYFGNLIVDPKDENKIFKPDGPLLLSVNGGSSFSVVSERGAWRLSRCVDRSQQPEHRLSRAMTADCGAATTAARAGNIN